MDKVLLIGIAGGSGSGKTTLANMIADEIGSNMVAIVPIDMYYNDLSHLKPAERKKVNFDHPNAIDWKLLKKDLKKLLNGKPIDMPIYDFKSSTRRGTKRLEPKKVVIVEGIFALYDKELLKMMDLRIFVDTPPDIRLIRRLKRDVVERGNDVDRTLDMWVNKVQPAYITFIEPSSRNAHIIIPEDPDGLKREVAVSIIKSKISSFYSEHKVSILYGYDGVEELFKMIVEEGKENYVMDSEGQFTQRMPEFSKWFVKVIEKKGIKIKHIVRKGVDVKPSKTTEVRYIDRKSKSPAVINIFSNKVAIILWTKIPEVILIEDINMVRSMKKFFDMVWEQAITM